MIDQRTGSSNRSSDQRWKGRGTAASGLEDCFATTTETPLPPRRRMKPTIRVSGTYGEGRVALRHIEFEWWVRCTHFDFGGRFQIGDSLEQPRRLQIRLPDRRNRWRTRRGTRCRTCARVGREGRPFSLALMAALIYSDVLP